MSTTASGFFYPDSSYTSGWRQAIQDAADASESVVTVSRSFRTFTVADSTALTALGSSYTLREGRDFARRTDNKITYRYNGTAWKAWESDWISHTPTWTGFTPGNGTVTAYYRLNAGRVNMTGHVVLGSTSSVTAAVKIAPAVSMDTSYYGSIIEPLGTVGIRDVGTSLYSGEAWSEASSTAISLMVNLASGTYAVPTAITGSVPIPTWATSDTFSWDFSYKAA